VAEWVNAHGDNGKSAATSDALLALIMSITGTRAGKQDDSARLEEDLQLDSLGRVQLQSALEEKFGLTLSDAMLEQVSTLGDLRRLLGLGVATTAEASPSDVAQDGSVAVAGGERDDIYPRWTWSWPVQAARVVFLECVLRPLVWLLAAPAVRRDEPHVSDARRGAPGVDLQQPLLLIANHVSTYDVPLVLYALPGAMRRHVAAAMAANMLEDWRKRRNQGSWVLNVLGPLTYLLVTGVFNVFPLPRSSGFRRSFQHAGEALDRGYNVLVFPEGRRSEDGQLQRFRSGIGLLVEQSKTQVLPIALAGLGGAKLGKYRWFRSGRLRVVVGSPMSLDAGTSAEEITERLQAEMVRLLNLGGEDLAGSS
jgi:long-chain acyl-CoA synthetase